MTLVVIRLIIEGVHKWEGCNIPEVSYLANEHRHLFHFKATKGVEHPDRDIEIVQLQHDIKAYLEHTYFDNEKRLCNFGSRSCEMLAAELCDIFELASCEVLEDGENGAIVFTKENK